MTGLLTLFGVSCAFATQEVFLQLDGVHSHPAEQARISTVRVAVSGLDTSDLTVSWPASFAFFYGHFGLIRMKPNLERDAVRAAGRGNWPITDLHCRVGTLHRRTGAEDADLGAVPEQEIARPPIPTCARPASESTESRADEITGVPAAQPGPSRSPSTSSTPSTGNPYRPLADVSSRVVASSYLVERRHKRELRRESAQEGTAIAVSQLADQERSLLFDLRTAFVRVLAAESRLGGHAREP